MSHSTDAANSNSTLTSTSTSSSTSSSCSSPQLESRGVFILFEGLDRSGKSSQCTQLVETLNTAKPKSAVQMRFPDRETTIGKMLDSYLRQTSEVEDHAIHLLFSANRWERHSDMLSTLKSGRHLIVDRYAYSGIAFTGSKALSVGMETLNFDWLTAPDRGLIAPDLVIFLDISSEDAAKRGSFGEERYEKKEIQDRVRVMFNKLREEANPNPNQSKYETKSIEKTSQSQSQSTTPTPSLVSSSSSHRSFGVDVEWSVVNAGRTREEVERDIFALAQKAIQQYSTQPIKYL